ncbi:MAG: group 1 glycosyl transferase [Chitinophagaceae bacterium]
MHRICHSLVNAGYMVTLVGRVLKTSKPLTQQSFFQKRLRCFFNKGFLFYAEYNLRLFFYLLFQRMDAICAIDLDTILPCLLISKIKSIPRIYDAHEYFTEMKELRTRPKVQRFWKSIERFALPKFDLGYTVSDGLAEQFKIHYKRNYKTIRNLPVLKPIQLPERKQKFLLFQGAVNEARGFEYLIPAMKNIPYQLVICGDGNFMQQLKVLIKENGVEDKVELKGMMTPEELRAIAPLATLGLGLAEKEGLNQYYALPNKFTEYMHAGLPQLAMDYPEYQKINIQYFVAVLLNRLDVSLVADTINKIMEDDTLLQQMHENALKARTIFCWQQEEKKLIHFYQTILPLE